MAHDWEPFYIQLQRVLDENDDRDEQKCLGIEENLIFKMIKGHLQNNQEMNDTIEILKADNLRLINKFNNEKLKCLTLQEKLKTIVKNQELFTKLKQEYHTMLKSVKESKPIKEEDKSTSMDTLMDTSDKSIQISSECQHCLTTNDLSLMYES
ncbi:hypothetical protein R5R35_006759 [Gryllus longicercus]|uniref:Uncharacterized protein n=1 Tax=Gryllus longicercus TaxID=2509291 RepID=A0AAN9YV02_9ORTH